MYIIHHAATTNGNVALMMYMSLFQVNSTLLLLTLNFNVPNHTLIKMMKVTKLCTSHEKYSRHERRPTNVMPYSHKLNSHQWINIEIAHPKRLIPFGINYRICIYKKGSSS